MNIYKKNIGYTLIKEDNDYFIVKSNDVFRANEIGARIFALCDGKNTINNIIEKLHQIYDIDNSILLNDIEEFIYIALENKIIK
ncbi:PqqD family protein [Clostridium sp.]|uniref:PqqD family protein n=1 Tax=Clostridium sp. TaxID=1506 RepID=UPI003F2E4828